MTNNLYCILDKVAGEFSPPWTAKNDSVAYRQFDYMMSQEKQAPASDFQLFHVGTYTDSYPVELVSDFRPVEINLGGE